MHLNFSLFKSIMNFFFNSSKIAYISGNFKISKSRFSNRVIGKVLSITSFLN